MGVTLYQFMQQKGLPFFSCSPFTVRVFDDDGRVGEVPSVGRVLALFLRGSCSCRGRGRHISSATTATAAHHLFPPGDRPPRGDMTKKCMTCTSQKEHTKCSLAFERRHHDVNRALDQASYEQAYRMYQVL